jgi:pimeloyl-ACP methyl ester carboxylesterase
LLAARGCRVIVPHLRPWNDPISRWRDTLNRHARVPTITLDGKADGVIPATDGVSSASKFTGPRLHHVIEAGHNLPEEAPEAFAGAVWQLATQNGNVRCSGSTR